MGYFGPRSSVGLDLGCHALKVAEVVRSGDTVRVERVGMVPTPPGAVSKGVAVDPDALVPAIRVLFQEAGIRAKRIVTALGAEAVVIREVTVPAMPEAELAQAVSFEAERYLPASTREARCDYRVLGRTPDDKQLELLLVATGKELIDRHLALLTMAGLTSEVMEATPLSMVRGVARGNGRNGHATMYVDLGAESSVILIVDGERVPLARTIAIGGNALTKAIAEALNIDGVAAETLKEQRAQLVVNGEQSGEETVGVLHQAMVPAVTRLASELRRSIEYYLARVRREAISNVVLTGGGAKLGNLGRFLSAAVGLPVEIGNPFALCDVGADVPPAYREDQAPTMAVAVGLAMRSARA